MRRLLILFFTLFLPATFFLLSFSAQAQTTPDGDSDAMRGFARVVDVAGGSIFIGEPANVHQPGVVYVYSRDDADWSEQTRLSASDGEIGDGFGSALSADENFILIGAPERDAAYLFERSGDSWSEASRFALSDTVEEGGFGESVALHGDLAFIGAPEADHDLGFVYVYRKADDGSWTQEDKIANPDTSKGTGLGSALATDGSRLLVGAPGNGGAAYVYQNNNGDWSLETSLESDQVDENGRFGSTLAFVEDQVLIGAPRHNAASGAVFVFNYDNNEGEWDESGQLVAFDSQSRYQFGSALAFIGTDAWIGAPNGDDGKGALYQFEQNSEGNWTGVRKLDGPERGQGDNFAGTIAVDENVAVAGLVGADYGAGTAAIMERDADDEIWAVQSTVLGKGGSILESITGEKVECTDNNADRFHCNNVNLLSFLPIEDIGGERGVRLNDMWGWTDPQTGKEYAIIGRNEGTSFVDVSDPNNPVYVGNLQKPDSARASTWRDIKVYENHAYVVADNAGTHGMQVLDLTELREFDGTPITFEETAHYDGIHSAHNVVINEDTGFAYVVGSSGGGDTCGGGLHMVNIQDPTNPTFSGCFADPSTGRSGTGYTHDAQCVIYEGPDEEYQGQEICVGANETAISIADVTDKENPRAISTASYPDYAYVHQGWFTEDQRYFFQNDELDELTGNVDQTRTIVWDMTDLDDPQFVREFFLDNPASDHNLYIKDETMYQSNYVSGLQVIDISEPENPVRKGYFDTHPFGEDQPGFAGTWSNYPFFDSGIVVMTSSREGLFILETQEREL